MKIILSLLTLFVVGYSHGQQFEFNMGLLENKFYDWDGYWPTDYGIYTSGANFYAGVSFHKIIVEDLHFGVNINYERFGGNLSMFTGGRGGGRSVNADVSKSIMAISLFPFNKRILKNLHIRLGFTFSTLLSERYSGTEKFSIHSDPSSNTEERLENKYKTLSNRFVFGVRGLIFYDIPLNETLYISPQYSYYQGLTPE